MKTTDIIKSLNKEAKKHYDSLDESVKKDYLSALTAMGTGADDTNDIDFAELTDNDDNTTILSLGKEIIAGQSIVARFLGTMPTFSLKFKENWRTEIIKGKEIFFGDYFLFENPKTGDQFGIYGTSSLWQLKKVPTLASKEALRPKSNPLVKISYVGLVEGREKLEKEHGIVLTKGNKSHVCKVAYPKDVIFDKYVKGIVNYLRNPLPILGSADNSELTIMETMASDYADQTGVSMAEVLGEEIANATAQQNQLM